MIDGIAGLTPAALAGVGLVTLVGAMLQGAVGFGMGMFAVPILLLIDPAFVPGPTLMAMSLLTLAMTWRERQAVQVRELAWAIGGRIPGVALALGFLTLMPAEAAEPVFGGLVLLAVGLSISGLHMRPRPGTLLAAGAMSGFMGTTVSIGGPPMALLYQHEPGPQVRATLSAFFTIGVAISLAGLALIGRFGTAELVRVGVLLPGTVAGFLLSGRMHRVLDRGYLRLAILVLAALMGGMVVARSLTSRGETLVVVTYNIRHGRGMDDQLDLERTAAVLRRFDADVVGLQEVDSTAERSGGVDQADSLGALLGMHHAFGAFMPYQGGAYGMAILSRYPMRRIIPVRLPDGNEPRIALAVEVELPDGSRIIFINVHFDWVEDDTFRFAQATALTGYLDTLSGPHILLGDFNDAPDSRTLALFLERLVAAGKPPADRLTFSSTEPVREIDYVFVAPPAAWGIRSVRVMDEPRASDHRPVVVRLDRRGSSPEN